MKILGFETSSPACSVAVGDGNVWLERAADAGQEHSAILLPMIDALLAEAGWRLGELDAIAFGAGPGSFTGLRIACGVAQGLAWGANLGVAPIGSLLALAEATGEPRVITAIDARMREVYLAAYQRAEGAWDAVVPPQVTTIIEARAPDEDGWFGAGSAFALDPSLGARLRCSRGIDPRALPSAKAVASLGVAAVMTGRLVAPQDAVPLYVRDRVALTMAERAVPLPREYGRRAGGARPLQGDR